MREQQTSKGIGSLAAYEREARKNGNECNRRWEDLHYLAASSCRNKQTNKQIWILQLEGLQADSIL